MNKVTYYKEEINHYRFTLSKSDDFLFEVNYFNNTKEIMLINPYDFGIMIYEFFPKCFEIGCIHFFSGNVYFLQIDYKWDMYSGIDLTINNDGIKKIYLHFNNSGQFEFFVNFLKQVYYEIWKEKNHYEP